MPPYSNPLLDRSVEVDSDPESAMKDCDPSHANLKKKYDELKSEYAKYKEDNEKTISRHKARIGQLRDDLIDHIFSRGIASAEEKATLERKITELEEVVKGLKEQALQS